MQLHHCKRLPHLIDKDKDKEIVIYWIVLSPLSFAVAAVLQNQDKAVDKFNQIFLRDTQKFST